MNNQSSNIFRKSSPILFAICAVVFAVVGIITFRDYGDGSWLCRTNWFWGRLIWFEAIFGLFWISVFGRPISRLLQHRHVTGATYAIVTSICLRASFVSFVVWSISSFISPCSQFAILPIIVQLLVALYYGIIAFMFPKTQALQTDGMERPEETGYPSSSALALKLEIIERSLSGEDAATVKHLKEKIRYSLPSVGKIASCTEYKQIAELVVKMGNNTPPNFSQACDELEKLVLMVIAKCKQ